MENLASPIGRLDKLIEDLSKEIKEKEAEIKEKEAEIKEKEVEIKEKEVEILVEGTSDKKFNFLEASVVSLRASVLSLRARLQTMEEQKLELIKQQRLQTNSERFDASDEKMESVVNNWTTTESDLFGLKRKQRRKSEDESDSEANDDGNTPKKQKVAHGDLIPVDTVLPITDGRWYLGAGSRPLYVRQCVKDLGAAIMKEILDKKVHHECAACWVISGASGIGTSWSINVFMTELLRNDLSVFFHSGRLGRAWLLSKNGQRSVEVEQIESIDDPNVIYVYDSPGSKGRLVHHSQARVRNNIGASLIFSSPKEENYDYARKTNGLFFVKNLPTWSYPEMRGAKPSEIAGVNSCYSVWGGNMQALDNFLHLTRQRSIEEAIQHAMMQLDAQISCIDKNLAGKMSKQLEKQQVNKAFSAKDLKDAPGRILTPEPEDKDPSSYWCFEEFFWRFCSPMAEKKFIVRAKSLGKGVVMDLLKNVFEVPCPKGVLFEKAAHFLITNGHVRKFRWCSYKDKASESIISFPECKVVNFETDKLKDAMKEELRWLDSKPAGNAVALEPTSASFDAVDMFVLVKHDKTDTARDWRLYLLQDTIARNHSLHPVKVLWYCALFLDAFNEVLPKAAKTGSVLDCCMYIAVVPHKSKGSFEFEKPYSNLKRWVDIDRVAQLLGIQWPGEFARGQDQLMNITNKMQLKIPPSASGGERALTKSVVGNAILNDPAAKKVKEMSFVIFDVLNC